MKKIISILFVSALLVFSCKKEKAEEPKENVNQVVKFSTDIKPIFDQNCAFNGCHSTSTAADGKVYETHAGASAVPDATTLGSIKHTAGFKQMPQGGTQLSSDKIAKIESWITSGKKND